MVAGNYYDRGELDELIEHCDASLKERPNDSYALWYKAKALYAKREYYESKQCFEKLAITEPSWNESHIRPYLEKINGISVHDKNR